MKTTPILALQLYMGHLSITFKIKEQATVSLTKIKALAKTTRATKTLDQQHLKTQMLTFNAVYRYPKQLQISTEVEQPLSPTTAPTEYPPEEYLRIYADGLLSKTDGKAGAGIHSKLFSHYISVGSNRTSIDGEITAIATALLQLLLRRTVFKKAVLLEDSKSAIQTVASNKQATTQTVKEARRTIKLLKRQGKTVAFQWVLSHIGIHSNETADLLAKKGTTLQNNKHHLTLKQLRDS